MATTYDIKLLRQHEVAAGTVEFVLERPAGFTYRAGQYADLKLAHKEGDSKSDYMHGFSFLSAPFEAELKMATRMRNSPFKNAIKALPDGAAIQLVAVFGDFVLHNNKALPAVFIIGGIGITPVLSMIKQALHDKTGHKLTLIYANKNRASAAYTDELEALARAHANFKFVPVYEDVSGYVNATTVQSHVSDIAGSKYYLSGPEGMVHAMRNLLMEVGADEDNIRTEEFDGY